MAVTGRATQRDLRELNKAVRAAERASYDDSNDSEIDALNDALDTALSLLSRRFGVSVPGLSAAERERLEREQW